MPLAAFFVFDSDLAGEHDLIVPESIDAGQRQPGRQAFHPAAYAPASRALASRWWSSLGARVNTTATMMA